MSPWTKTLIQNCRTLALMSPSTTIASNIPTRKGSYTFMRFLLWIWSNEKCVFTKNQHPGICGRYLKYKSVHIQSEESIPLMENIINNAFEQLKKHGIMTEQCYDYAPKAFCHYLLPECTESGYVIKRSLCSLLTWIQRDKTTLSRWLRDDAPLVLRLCLRKLDRDRKRGALRRRERAAQVQLRESRRKAKVSGLPIDRSARRPQYVANLLRVKWNRCGINVRVSSSNSWNIKAIVAM